MDSCRASEPPHEFLGGAFIVAQLCGRVVAPYYFELAAALISTVPILVFSFAAQIAQVGVENETAFEGPIVWTGCESTGGHSYWCSAGDAPEQQVQVPVCDASYYVYAEGEGFYDLASMEYTTGAFDFGSRAGQGFISVPCGNQE